MKSFALAQHKEFDSHCCYGAMMVQDDESHRIACERINGVCPLDYNNYEIVQRQAFICDYYVRLRFDNGSRLYEQFYASEKVECDEDAIVFPMTLPSWPALSRAHRYFDRRERGFIGQFNNEAYHAWENTSVLIVAIRNDGRMPVLLGAGYSFPVIHCGGIQHGVSMYFTDLPSTTVCLDAGERCWYLPYVDPPNNSDISYEIMLITSESEVTWLVLEKS
jgi:hypothetical protein